MKTLTVTFHHGNNYGALFQMFSLHKTIRNLGHENVVLETWLIDNTNKKIKKGLMGFLRDYYIQIFSLLRKKDCVKLNNSFLKFKKNHVLFTRPYTSMDDLRYDVPDVDCLITGSDQVWNMSTVPPMVPSRFLDFGTDDLIRFSFAASIENMSYSEEQRKYVKEQLKRYKGISLREESAREYIHSLTGLPAIRLLDPVFLLSQEQWREISFKPRIKGPYILCYQVLSNKKMQKVTKILSKRTGFPVVSICNLPFKWIRSDYSFFDISPEEFIGLYANAAMIVTTSFHGTAFGIIFNKPTYSLTKSVSNNRIIDMMKFFALEDYVIKDDFFISSRAINWENINYTIEEERKKSLRYLMDMLKV